MSAEGICILVLIAVSVAAILTLGIRLMLLRQELDTVKSKLAETKATADAYDYAACRHNGRANMAEVLMERAETRARLAEAKLEAMGRELRELKLQLDEWKRFKCSVSRGKVSCKPRK